MSLLSLLIIIVWVAFWIYWFIKAGNTKRASNLYIGRWIGFRFILIIAIVFIIRLTTGSKGNYYYDLDIRNLTVKIIGTVILLAGLSLAVWARVYLGQNWGTPMSHKEDPELVTSGPYKYVRHPIYTGILTGFLGTALSINIYWLIVLVVFVGYFFYSATKEEEYLTKKFPKDYAKYKKHSKMLIPFIL